METNEELPTTAQRAADLRDERKARFVEALATYGNVTAAATNVGIDRRTAYRWLEADAAFASAVHEARKGWGDMLRSKLWEHVFVKNNLTALIVALKVEEILVEGRVSPPPEPPHPVMADEARQRLDAVLNKYRPKLPQGPTP